MSLFTGLHPHQHGYGVNFEVGRVYPLPEHLLYLPRYLQEPGIATYGFHNGGIMEPQRGLGLGWTSWFMRRVRLKIGGQSADASVPLWHSRSQNCVVLR